MIPLQAGLEQISQERREAGRIVRTGQWPDQSYADLVRHKPSLLMLIRSGDAGVTAHDDAPAIGSRRAIAASNTAGTGSRLTTRNASAGKSKK